MSQSRKWSFIEVMLSTAIGFSIAFVTNYYVLPYYGHHVTYMENFQITVIFTFISIVRSYIIRRIFNWYAQR